MKTWSNIPNEILNLIAVYCGRDCKKVKWMFVNKRWFTFYLSQAYSTIKISLGNESVINKNLNSPFDIGKYVTHIYLSDIQKPENLNEIDLSNDILGLIMKRTPNVLDVSFFQSNKEFIYQDWLYFSMVLVNSNCWNLLFLPVLGPDNIFSAGYYYACAYYSRHTLNELELTFSMLRPQNFSTLKEFTVLESLKVHKNMVNGLIDLESLLRFIPKLYGLTVRFATNRVCSPIKKEYSTYSGIKKLWLYNFTPQNNDELLILVKGFSALENLQIFGEINKTWLGNVNGPLAIDTFISGISSIPKYEITMPGDKQEIAFSEFWLKSIKNPGQDVHLVLSYSDSIDQDYSKFKNNVAATFYGGSIQSTPTLKYTMLVSQSLQGISDRLRVLYHGNVSYLRIEGLWMNFSQILSVIIAQERFYLKQITILNCTLEEYISQPNTTTVPQHIKRIIFRKCKINFLSLKAFLKEFKSLDYIEFDNCAFIKGIDDMKSIDMGNTNIKSMKIFNFRKILPGYKYTDTVQNVITISIYLATQNVTRYFSVVENNLFKTTRLTYDMFCQKFNPNEAAILNIKANSMQELSFMLTDTSKMFKLSLA